MELISFLDQSVSSRISLWTLNGPDGSGRRNDEGIDDAIVFATRAQMIAPWMSMVADGDEHCLES